MKKILHNIIRHTFFYIAITNYILDFLLINCKQNVPIFLSTVCEMLAQFVSGLQLKMYLRDVLMESNEFIILKKKIVL